MISGTQPGHDFRNAARPNPANEMYRVMHRHSRGEAPGTPEAKLRKAARSMFERFTDRARRVVVLAQEEARLLKHDHIDTEHILLGLIHEGEGVAAKALQALRISLEAVRQQVEEIIGQGQQAPSGHIPFTPRAKKVLELSLREALQLGHNYIGTEHILLGLIREGEGVAAQVLVKLGGDLDTVRQQVIHVLAGYQGKEKTRAARAAAGSGKAGRGKRKLRAQLIGRLDSVESRLAALEQRVGTEPDVRDLDQEIKQVRRDKESAIDAEEFETAAVLRDKEKQLLAEKASRREEWAATHVQPSSLTDEIERLRGLLRQHGIEPQDGAA
jgi:ATP-dependent Clp protease ATP-binding subunit ClpC